MISSSQLAGTPGHVPASASLYLGTMAATGAPYLLSPDALTRGVYVRGAIGSGKTSLLGRLLMGRGLHQPFLNYDYIGTGHRELETWIAPRRCQRRASGGARRRRGERTCSRCRSQRATPAHRMPAANGVRPRSRRRTGCADRLTPCDPRRRAVVH